MRGIHGMRMLLSGLSLGLLLLLQLAVHAANAAPAARDAEWTYRIQPGDSLLTLSEALLEPEYSWRELMRHNRIADPQRLRPGSTLRMPIAWLRREASVARVIHLQGEVTLQRGSGAPSALALGQELRAGDRLSTGAQGAVSLRFVDGSRLLISPGSRLGIEELLVHGRSAIPVMRLKLEAGSVENKVQPNPAQAPRYEIRSPSLNLGVRGTEFRVQADAASSRAQVIEGKVAALQAAGELPIPAGFGALARPGETKPSLQALLPPPDLSGLPTRLERLPPGLTWRPLAGASSYRAQVFAQDGDAQQLLAEAVVKQNQAVWPALAEQPDGRYRLRVRGIDAQGHEGLSAEAGFELKARPEPPFLQTPASAAALYGEQVRFSWTRALAAQRYRLQVAADASFAAPLLFDQDGLSDTEQTVTLQPGTYHWRLASIARKPDGSADPGPFSDAQTFTLRQLPPSPAVQAPEIGDQIVLRWRAVPGMSYQLQWASDAGFSQGLKAWDSAEAQASLERPAPGRYYLRVRSVDAHGQAGPWGSVQQLDVPQPRWLWLLPLGLLLLVGL